MRQLHDVFRFVFVFVVMSSLARSQSAPGIGPESPLVILMAPSVQKELKLTDEQKDKVYNVVRDASQKSRQLMQQVMMRGGGDPRGLIDAGQALRRENDLAIGNLLEKKQNARFEQIVLQSEGPLAVGRREIATKLQLSANQNQAVQAVMGQFQQMRFQMMMMARRAAMTGAPAGNIEQETRKLREETVRQLGKIVTKKQKDAFNEMLGAPFDISKISAEPAQGETASEKKDGAEEPPAAKVDDATTKVKSSRKGTKSKSKTP